MVARALRRAVGGVACAVVVSACASSGANGPFGALPGSDRASTAKALKARGFCPPPQLRGKQMTFPRCPTPGLELWVSRVDTTFEKEALVRAARVEVHASEGPAMRRWHDLVAERAGDGRQRAAAGDRVLRSHGELSDGSMSWVVWNRDGYVHAVLLVRPPGQDSYEVIEVIRRAR